MTVLDLSPADLAPYPKALARFPEQRQSLLSDFDACGLSTAFEIRMRVGWSTHPQARGQVFHRVAAKCLREMASTGEERIPIDVAMAILHEVLRQEDVDRECPHCMSREIKSGVKNGRRRCASCGGEFQTEIANLPLKHVEDLYWTVRKWAKDNAWPIQFFVAAEERLRTKVEYPNRRFGGSFQRTVTGQIDALFLDPYHLDHAIVDDWKDTWQLPPETEVSFEGYFQQRFYALLVMDNYRSIDRVTLRERYVRRSQQREATIYRDDLEQVREQIAEVSERFDRAFEERVWTPTPGKQCSWCIAPSRCPIPQEARDIGRIRSQDEAERVAATLIVAEAVQAKAKDALKAWADVHGPVPIRDAKGRRAFGYVERKVTTRPDQKAMEKALAEGVDPLTLYREERRTVFDEHRPPRPKASDLDREIIASLEGALAERKAAES